MAMKLSAAGAGQWLRPSSQEKEQNPAEFKIRPLSQLEYLELVADYWDAHRQRFRGRGVTSAIHTALLDWKNVTAPDGSEQKFDLQAVSMIEFRDLSEIGSKIIEISRLTEEQRKN